METPSDDRPPPTQPQGPTVLPYQSGTDQINARFGMPTWGQFVFGCIFFLAAVVLVALTAAAAGSLSVVVFVGLIVIAAHIHRDWRWEAFTGGILIAFCGCILTFGVCAVIMR